MLVGILAFFSLAIVALFGERIAPHEPIYFVVEHGTDPRPYDPGLVFPFGSDILGRDLFSLVLAGARQTLSIVVLGGLARVLAGLLAAAISSWWRLTRLATESIAELISAVPATLLALIVVKVFLKADASVAVVIGALLVTGWAGPYRVIRAEIDRLGRMSFTQGASALGVGRWRLFWRHHLPHLVPVVALNLSQQVVASLVLVAELGVLGVFVGATRLINIEESLSRVTTGILTIAPIGDPPEWGGLLANARTIESLWLTRWLFVVPGLAFACTALAVALIGFAFARTYARRDFIEDLRSRVAGALALSLLALFVVSALVPERFLAAREWADSARSSLAPTADTEIAFSEAGLRPLAATYAVRRDSRSIVQTGAAALRVGTGTLVQQWPRQPPRPPGTLIHLQSLVTAETGGGVIDAPLVFVGRGITPSDYPPQPANPFGRPDIGARIKDYADDYAGVDVRGKVVLLVRFLGVAAVNPNPNLNGYAFGPSVEDSIGRAIKHGAAAVLFVDRDLSSYTDGVENFTNGLTAGLNPYLRLQRNAPATATSGVPVLVLDASTAQSLVTPLGLDLTPFFDFDEAGSDQYKHSPSRDLGITARVEVPLARQTASVTSFVGEVQGVPADIGRVLIWAIANPGARSPASDVGAALARELGPRHVPFIFVDFDPSIDPMANTQTIDEVLKGRRITLVLVLDQLEGGALRFTTPYGDLVPMMDLYAEKAGARFEETRTTPPIDALAGVAPLIQIKTVLVTGVGGAGDLRPDAAALVGYLAGRLSLGAEELPR
jgi:ABC-type dipeptide/oligopeptide/nickel transport system permease subunit